MAVTPVVLALSRSGETVARRVADALDAPLHGREGRVERADAFFADALEHARDLFAAGTPVIGVCASGILIRAVAPQLSDKRAEPPVISVSDDGRVVVPLLGGHRGANRLAKRIAEALEGTAAVTTAGDVSLGVALDEPPLGYRLVNSGDAKGAMAALLSGGGATVTGDAPWLAGLPRGDALRIIFTSHRSAPCWGWAAPATARPRSWPRWCARRWPRPGSRQRPCRPWPRSTSRPTSPRS